MADAPSENSEQVCSNEPSLIRTAFSWPVVRRALGFAVVVGSVLVFINHGSCCILNSHYSEHCVLQMGLTVCVPYVVSTLSSVMAIRESRRSCAE